MQFYTIAYTIAMFALYLFLAIGGYILSRDRYWRRIWKELGKPEVKSIKELKTLAKEQRHSSHHCTQV